MGFLNNTTVTVDAILTKKGRELLAQGTEAFNITKFALADDEVDYGLWDTTHPNGSDYYGAVIENMPLLEATPDENHVMRYKLLTLDKGTTKLPTISISPGSIEFNKEDKHCKHCGKPRSVYDKPQFTFTHEDVKKLHPTTYLYEEEE